MTAEEATLIAAAVAAVASTMGLFLQWGIQRATERRSAFRKHLESTLPIVGDELYQVIALAVGIAKARSNDQFKFASQRAIEATKHLDTARRAVRYPLWGLDEGFQAVRRVPLIVTHFRHDTLAQDRVIATATSLRETLDKAIRRAYIQGRRPGLYARLSVRARARELNALFSAPDLDDSETEA